MITFHQWAALKHGGKDYPPGWILRDNCHNAFYSAILSLSAIITSSTGAKCHRVIIEAATAAHFSVHCQRCPLEGQSLPVDLESPTIQIRWHGWQEGKAGWQNLRRGGQTGRNRVEESETGWDLQQCSLYGKKNSGLVKVERLNLTFLPVSQHTSSPIVNRLSAGTVVNYKWMLWLRNVLWHEVCALQRVVCNLWFSQKAGKDKCKKSKEYFIRYTCYNLQFITISICEKAEESVIPIKPLSFSPFHRAPNGCLMLKCKRILSLLCLLPLRNPNNEYCAASEDCGGPHHLP